MIIVPNKQLILPRSIHIGLKGAFRFETINKFSGKVTSDTGWFPNTVLDAGRNRMGEYSDWLSWCQVGTDGNFPVSLADKRAETALGAWHAGTNTIVPGSTSNGQAGSAPYYGWARKSFRFDAGTVAANLSEAAVGWGVDGSQITTRAPILDPVLQTPTTVTPLADELLHVSYEFRYYPPLVDILLPQITLDGVVYDTVTRAASVTGDRWSASIGNKMGKWQNGLGSWFATDGALGTILTGPSGVSAACDNTNHYDSTYSANSYQTVMNASCGITGWNLGAGIRCLRIQTTAGDYQSSFASNPGGLTIPKTTSYQMAMAWTLSWAELPPLWVAGTYSTGDRVTHNDVQWESDIDTNTSEPGVADWTLV